MTDNPTENWGEIFPALGPKYSEGPRPIQTETLDKLAEDRPKFALLELPVGVGKSALAVAYAEVLRDFDAKTVADQAAYLTATISLQEQYARDFPGMALVKGKGNFACSLNNLNASEGQCQVDGPEASKLCESAYYPHRNAAYEARHVVANYSLYLSEIFYAQGFLGRSHHHPKLVVCDEAHRLLDQLTDFSKVKVTVKQALELGFDPPIGGWQSLDDVQYWVEEVMDEVKDQAVEAILQGSKTARALNGFRKSLEKFSLAGKDFIPLKVGIEFEAAPLWPTKIARTLFKSADKFLLMSGTMYGGHLLAQILGLGGNGPSQYRYYTAPSPFDARRWPVHVRPVASLSQRAPDSAWTAVGNEIHRYIHEYTNTKGIVHVTSAKQLQRLLDPAERCGECRPRIVRPHASDARRGRRRADVLSEFRRRGPGTWLAHYSVGEGESFDDDRARLQLIAKIPYPDLGDTLIKLRSEEPGIGRKLYSAMTLGKVAQTAGRIMRHEKDYGETIILDGSFGKLWSWNKNLAPGWFKYLLT